MKTRNLAAATAALLLLAACGGSSKPPAAAGRTIAYTGSTSAVTLTGTSDKDGLASGAASLAQGFSGVGSMATGFAAGTSQTPAFVKNALSLAAGARHQADLGATVSGATLEVKADCPGGGSMSLVAHDADGISTTTHAGDYVQISFASCEDQAGTVTHGSLKLKIDAVPTNHDDFVAAASSITKDAAFGLTLTFTHFWSIDALDNWSGMNGEMSVAFTATYATQTLEYRVSGPLVEGASGVGSAVDEAFRLVGFQNVGTETYTGMGTANAAPVKATWDLDSRVCALQIGGCLNVLTDPSFAKNEAAAYPYEGALKVSDDTSHFVKVAVTNENGAVTLSWDLGAGEVSLATTWACLDSWTVGCPTVP